MSFNIRDNGQMPDTPKKAKVEISSYFSIDTDLAALMRDWPEFVRGDGYDVELRSQQNGECVTTHYESYGEAEGTPRELVVEGTAAGPLFQRVLGAVTYALACHSDNLMINRVS
jgi:hypothetical protein